MLVQIPKNPCLCFIYLLFVHIFCRWESLRAKRWRQDPNSQAWRRQWCNKDMITQAECLQSDITVHVVLNYFFKTFWKVWRNVSSLLIIIMKHIHKNVWISLALSFKEYWTAFVISFTRLIPLIRLVIATMRTLIPSNTDLITIHLLQLWNLSEVWLHWLMFSKVFQNIRNRFLINSENIHLKIPFLKKYVIRIYYVN